MKPKISHRTRWTLLTLSIATSGAAQAHEMRWQPFLSVTPVYQGKGDLDGGGHYSAQSAMMRIGVLGELGRSNRASATLKYDYTDHSFSHPGRFGNAAPWNSVQRYGVSTSMSFGLDDGWSVGLAPSFDWFHENGSDAGDAFTWGGIVSASKRFENDNRLGFGMGAFDRIEETSVFPFLLVDWRIGDRWRLMNPLPAGPTGPAGLELEYRFDTGWNVGIGAAWRNARFRLRNDGAVPNGIGEERGVPVFFRATRTLDEQTSLNLYAGLVTAGQLRIEDSSGRELNRVDFDTAPLFGATYSARF